MSHRHFCLAFVSAVSLLATSRADEPRRVDFGLEKRIPWTTSRLVGSPEPPKPFATEPAFRHLEFQQPVELLTLPGTNRLVVLELRGKIFTFENQPQATKRDCHLFADLTQLPKFNRLYGIAFHPQYPANRTCFLSYVLPAGTPDGTRVSRFRVTDSQPPRLDLASEEIVITWLSGGHNGAHLQFGPDGCLYISTGDGSDPFPPDTHNTGQRVDDLLSSILRIDVDHADPGRKYRIPTDNPFVNLPGARGEVWAFGLRNPWKMCFHPTDGSLWVGDVGWELWEMIYRVERGGNYGWSLVEGPQPVHRERTRGPTPVVPAVVAHDHTESRSITGGYFYSGQRMPELRGTYVYSDYVTGKVWALRYENGRVTWRDELVDTPLQVVSLGVEASGELLLADYVSGQLHRLVPKPARAANVNFPRRLSETGLFASTADHRPAPGVIPYSVNAEPWADDTTADRFVALPGESRLGLQTKSDVQLGRIAGEWQFPDGGVLAKTISLHGRRLETQVLHYDIDTWRAYNFIWNDEQTDATLATDGLDRKVGRQTWHHASRNECLLCHTTRAGSIHGFRLPQLARDQRYGDVIADQLGTLDHVGLFEKPLPEKRTAWVDPYDATADLTARARSYLHVNCGHCHRPGGGGTAPFDVQITTDLAKAKLLNVRPTQGTFNIHGARLVTPGDPYRSVLYYRLSKLGNGRMPQFGSRLVDPRGTRLLYDWISSLPPDAASPPAPDPLADALHLLTRPETTSPSVQTALSESLSSTGGALQLATLLARDRLPGPARDSAIAAGAKHADPIIRDLFEPFIPEEQRTRRLGSEIRATDILALTGDATRGRQLFVSGAGVQCRNCHRLPDTKLPEKPLGPDLAQIGKKYDRAKILENILEPSKSIDPQWQTQLVETTTGKVLSGLLVERTDAGIVLRQANGEEVRIPQSEVDLFAPQQKSLMPELLLQDLTAEQVADLLAFLTTLK